MDLWIDGIIGFIEVMAIPVACSEPLIRGECQVGDLVMIDDERYCPTYKLSKLSYSVTDVTMN